MSKEPEMLWIDLETTGLYAHIDMPLELGLTVTDKWGAVIDQWKTLIWEPTSEFQKAIDDAPAVVKEMHSDNGLWSDLKRFAVRTRTQAEKDAILWLDSVGVESYTLPMSGSSIGSLDRPFCITHLPHLHSFFHYRNIDISSVRELCRMHNPTLLSRIEESLQDTYLEKHRVLEDIQDSILLYRAMYENFLFLED